MIRVKPAKKPLRNRDERVAGYLFHNLALTRDSTEAEEVLHSSKVGRLNVLCETALVRRLGRGQEVLPGVPPLLSLGSVS
jgi:hypothetical protein